MATPTTASAVPDNPNLKDYVCKYVGTPATGEHLKNGNDGLIWVDSHASQGSWFNDAHGASYVLFTNVPRDPKPSTSLCPPGRVQISVDIHFVDPTCEDGPGYYLTGDTDHVTVSQSAEPMAGAWITVTATAKSGYVFAGYKSTYVEHHKFGKTPTDCVAYDASATPSWTEPSCENENTPAFDVTGEHMTFELTDGTLEPGATIEVTATADAGHMFPGDPPSATKVFEHTFEGPEVGCTVVEAPVIPEPPAFVEPTCTTEAGVQLPDNPVVEESANRGTETVNTGTIEYTVTGDIVAGGTVTVDAAAVEGYYIPEGETTHWTHTFTVPTGCTIVEPPVVEPPVEEATETEAETVTPTVVESGLAGQTSSTYGEGLALMTAGLLVLAGAGALRLRKGGERQS